MQTRSYVITCSKRLRGPPSRCQAMQDFKSALSAILCTDGIYSEIKITTLMESDEKLEVDSSIVWSLSN